MSPLPLNQLGVVKRNIARADKAAVEKLSRFGVATIHEAMDSLKANEELLELGMLQNLHK